MSITSYTSHITVAHLEGDDRFQAMNDGELPFIVDTVVISTRDAEALDGASLTGWAVLKGGQLGVIRRSIKVPIENLPQSVRRVLPLCFVPAGRTP